MNEQQYRPDYYFRKLQVGEKVESFDCGDDDLNDFILNAAPSYRKEMLAAIYVAEDANGKVAAFFTLSSDKISLYDFDGKTEFNRFRKRLFANAKRLKSYPAVKIGRLGVDLSARDCGLGSLMLNYIKGLLTEELSPIGWRFITVDAYIEAIPFYQKNMFKALTERDKDDAHTRLLIFDLKQVTAEE